VGIETMTLDQQQIDVGSLAHELQERALGCTDVGVLSVSSADRRDEAHRLGRIAAQLGAKICVTVLTEALDEQVLYRLQECTEVLARYGVRLALEFLPYGPLSTVSETIKICERVGWEHCGVLLDTWHVFHTPPAWELLQTLEAEHIALLQVNDAPAPISDALVFESRFRRLPPGQGRFDYSQVASVLRTIRYDGVVSPEILSTAFRSTDPERAARHLYAATVELGSSWRRQPTIY
jgi:sugar phosphate isomerase/epimerase